MLHVIDGIEHAGPQARHAEPAWMLHRGIRQQHSTDSGGGSASRCVLLGRPKHVPTYLAHAEIIDASLLAGRSQRGLRALAGLGDAALMVWGLHAARWFARQQTTAIFQATLMLLDGPRWPKEARREADLVARFERVVVFDEDDRCSWLEAGVPASRVSCESPRVVSRDAGRAERRDELGLDADELLIAPIASPWCVFNAQRFIYMIGLLRVLGVKASALIPASAWRLSEARLYRRRSGLATGLYVVDGVLEPWLSACDAAFVDAIQPRERGMPRIARGALRAWIAAADAAGVPIAVSPRSVFASGDERPLSVADELMPLLSLLRNKAGAKTHGHSSMMECVIR